MKSPVTRIIAIIAAVIILAIIVYDLTADRFSPGPAAQEIIPPATIPGSIETSIDLKLAQLKTDLEAAYTSRQPLVVSLTLTEPEANEAAGRLIRESGSQIAMQIKGISVGIQPGNVLRISIDAVTFGITYNAMVTSSLLVNNGALDIRIDSVDVPLVLSSYKDSISAMVKQATELILKRLTGGGLGYEDKIDLQFTDVRTDHGSLTIIALAKPKG